MISQCNYGSVQEQVVTLYTLSNELLSVSVMDYGATIVSLRLNDETQDDMVLGFDSLADYVTFNTGPHFGACIGRVCNRIGKGHFSIKGVKYQCALNNGPNTLHGGLEGFDRKVFKSEIIEDKLIMTYRSAHMEEGFPGNLDLKVTIQLDGSILKISYDAISDADTLINITNHSYFNLSGKETCLDHLLMIPAKKIACVDSEGLALGEQLNVLNTPFDFNQFKTIGQDIDDHHSQIKLGNGYDHHFIVEGQGLRLVAQAVYRHRQLKVYSDLPGLQLYTANFLNPDDFIGKAGRRYCARDGFCLETQYYPNAINYPSILDPMMLQKDSPFHSQTWFEFTY